MAWNSWNAGSWDSWTGSDSWGGSDSWSGTAGYFPEHGGGKGSMMSERELANLEWDRSHNTGMSARDADEWALNKSSTSTNPYDFDAKGCNLASSRDLARKVMQERSARPGDDKRTRSRSRSRKRSRKGTRRRRKSSSSSASSTSSSKSEKKEVADLQERQRIEKIANAARVNRIKKRRQAARNAAAANIPDEAAAATISDRVPAQTGAQADAPLGDVLCLDDD